MISIEKIKRTPCLYENNGCGQDTCPLNVFGTFDKSTFTVNDIPADKCGYIKNMVFNNKIDSSIAIWMKKVDIEGNKFPMPDELIDILERKATEPFIPGGSLRALIDGTKRPILTINQGKQIYIKYFFWHTWKHFFCSIINILIAHIKQK